MVKAFYRLGESGTVYGVGNAHLQSQPMRIENPQRIFCEHNGLIDPHLQSDAGRKPERTVTV